MALILRSAADLPAVGTVISIRSVADSIERGEVDILEAVDRVTAARHQRLTYQAYNALDAALTKGVWDELHPKLDADTNRVYRFEMGMQGPAMTLQVRGIRVNEKDVAKARGQVEKAEKKAEHVVNEIAKVWWGKGLNPRSPIQLKPFLYEVLGLPPQRNKEGKIGTGVEELEKLQKFPRGAVLCKAILRCRDLRKQLGFLNAKRSRDGALRSSFNVGATETGRWSASKNAFGEGLNLQNVFKALRYVFIPRKGLLMGNADLKTAESQLVAYLSGDAGYIEAHKASDTHTYVAKLIWPDAGWTGDDDADKTLAKKPGFYRHFSRRDLAKRVQHGSNYGASEYALARILHIPLSEARDLLNKYKRAFPGIFRWQEAIKLELRKKGVLTTPLGRRRQFYDRVWEGKAQRDAIAFIPQSMVGDILNVGLWRVWTQMDGDGLWILNQGHDAILFEFEPSREAELLPRITELMKVEVEINGQTIVIPADVGTGANWLEAADPDLYKRVMADLA